MWRSSLKHALAAALLLLTAGGCRPQPEGAVKVVVIGDELKLVDPAAGPVATPEAVMLENVAQGLVRFDARGEIVPGLAERWNVSDDGLSYIFRIASTEWPSGRRITAQEVARILRGEIGPRSDNSLKDELGAVDEIVAMTDRVIEIRLNAPRPNLLQLLAQPELALQRESQGSGPFEIAAERGPAGEIRLERGVAVRDQEEERREEVWLSATDAPAAVRAFAEGKIDLVVGGTFADLPAARAARLQRNTLHFDPVSGLFGLIPARRNGPLADVELRRLLAQAIDRDALIEALDVPGLLPRATVLEGGLEGIPQPAPPAWMATPTAERRTTLAAEANRMFGDAERPMLRVALPDGPGARLLLGRLQQDWSVLGIRVERAERGFAADLRLIDAVAPSTSPVWFLRQFRCGMAPVCDEEADELLEAARAAPVAAQRAALLGEAARLIDQQQLFLPIAAPVRWSLVSRRVQGFDGNRFARHTLTGLEERLDRERAE